MNTGIGGTVSKCRGVINIHFPLNTATPRSLSCSYLELKFLNELKCFFR